MNGRFSDKVTTALTNGTLTRLSPVTDIPYIGLEIAARMIPLRIHNVRDLVQYFNTRNVNFIRDNLTLLTQNARQNQCIKPSEQQAQDFAADNNDEDIRLVRYQIGDVNYPAFNSLRALLAFAKRHPADFGRPDIDIHALPAAHTDRGPEACFCGCFRFRRVCERFDSSCQWIEPGDRKRQADQISGCIPLNETHGFSGAGNYKGQYKPEAPGKPIRGLYTEDWKQPAVNQNALPILLIPRAPRVAPA